MIGVVVQQRQRWKRIKKRYVTWRPLILKIGLLVSAVGGATKMTMSVYHHLENHLPAPWPLILACVFWFGAMGIKLRRK